MFIQSAELTAAPGKSGELGPMVTKMRDLLSSETGKQWWSWAVLAGRPFGTQLLSTRAEGVADMVATQMKLIGSDAWAGLSSEASGVLAGPAETYLTEVIAMTGEPGEPKQFTTVTRATMAGRDLAAGADPLGLAGTLAQKRKLLAAVEAMREANPMLGLRGVRLGIHLPSLVRMQVRAILEAACACTREGIKVKPKIMIPLTAHTNELRVERAILEAEAAAVTKEQGIRVRYQFGTMIEIPRAAVTADKIASFAEFFSFGTNDLTQTTFGISRDDAETGFLQEYLEKRILPENPFATIDQDGVGKLMQVGVALGRLVYAVDDLTAKRLRIAMQPVIEMDIAYYLLIPEARAGLPAVIAFRTWIEAQAADFRRDFTQRFRRNMIRSNAASATPKILRASQEK